MTQQLPCYTRRATLDFIGVDGDPTDVVPIFTAISCMLETEQITQV